MNIDEIFESYEKKKEEEIRQYCRENGLDESKPFDYSKAAMAVLEYMPPVSSEEAVLIGEMLEDIKRYGNIKATDKPCSIETDRYNYSCQCESENNIESGCGIWDTVTGKDKCPKGTVFIEPNSLLRGAGYKKSSKIQPFKKGCYGMMEYAAFYAMNKLAECAVMNLNNIEKCTSRYLEFRQDGVREFRKRVVK